MTFAFVDGDFDTGDDTLVVNVVLTEEFKDIMSKKTKTLETVFSMLPALTERS